MKPYIAYLMEHNGRTCLLPIPAKYRELVSCVRTLGLKGAADEDDLETIAYESLIGIKPELTDDYQLVEDVAEALSKLTQDQVMNVVAVCKAFNIGKFTAIGDVINFLELRGEKTDEEA